MTTLKQILIALTFILSVESCNNSPDVKAPTNSADSSTTSQTDYEDGPPFKVECKANFTRFGEYKISDDNCNIYYCGKDWNSNLNSCTWTWGEIINNEFPQDTNVTFIKVHLLDLDKFSIPHDGSDYGHDSLKKYVIAVYSRSTKGGSDNLSYDPFKTGKYSEPK